MKALVIGAGRIGCGVAAPLLMDSGFEVVFVVRKPMMLHYLNDVGSYQVELVHNSKKTTRGVNGVRAIYSLDEEPLRREIEEADVIVTAVGPANLPDVAQSLRLGLARRRDPVNVIAMENLVNAGPYLEQLTMPRADSNGVHRFHGFSGALIDRIVPEIRWVPEEPEKLTVRAEPQGTFVVDGSRLLPPVPKIEGMVVTHDYQAWVRRKLFTFSAGHAACAYLGFLKGYRYVHTAIRDEEIWATVLDAMTEGQRGVRAYYGPEIAGTHRDLLAILERFENAALNDPVARVARDPLRKLGADDRLVGAARLAEEAGIRPRQLSLAVAAALHFHDPQDPSAAELRRGIQESGVGAVLNQVSRLDPDRGLGRSVVRHWRKMSRGSQEGNFLLRLDPRLWAWS